MLELLAFLRRYAHVLLFVLFEFISFILIVNFNQAQRDIFLHSSSLFSGMLMQQSSQVEEYLSLKETNDKLLAENSRLLEELLETSLANEINLNDSSISDAYDIIPARVINNSISSTRNTFTLNKGSKNGISSGMAVITEGGVVGIITNVSGKFSSGLSIIHVDCRLSASLDSEEYFGTISWNGRNFNELQLTGIPAYAEIEAGQKIVTNGFSTIFPPDILIGTVSSYQLSPDGIFHEITVVPNVDLPSINLVYVVKNNFADERSAIENE